MNIRVIIITISGILAIIASLPYLRDTAKGKTKPRVVSWFIWAALTGIGGAAALAQHQLPAAILAIACAAQCGTIVILGIRHGDKKIEALDWFSLIGAAFGLGALIILQSPVWAVAITIATDFIGGVPTIKHAWLQSEEETISTYSINCIACLLVLCLANFHVFTAVAYPLYLFLFDGCMVVILLRHQRPQPAATISDRTAASSPTITNRATQPAPEPAPAHPTTPLVTPMTDAPLQLGTAVWSENPVPKGDLTTAIVAITPQTASITGAEYFIGPDPGPGNGRPAALIAGSIAADIIIDAPGKHLVSLRAKDGMGAWSDTSHSFLQVY